MERALLEKERPSLAQTLEEGIVALWADRNAGFWWYTLEANESIGAGYIQLMHFLGDVDPATERGLVRRILQEQQPDGGWSLFFEGPADLSTTVEAYFALRLTGLGPDEPSLQRARRVIISQGGLDRVRVFTKIHLALFGILPWSSCPAMPTWMILLPLWSRLSIYEFSSWARASIVPLLIVLDKKPVVPLSFNLDELRHENSPCPALQERDTGWFFFALDKIFKKLERIPWHPGRQRALGACEKWVRDHIERTEDIYPAMAYGALAIKALGYPSSDPTIRKALSGLHRFQQPAPSEQALHQQCCISPLWDTPWAGRALLEAGIPPDDPRLLETARYLVGKQTTFRGDWTHKNPSGNPGGWAFEFQNDWFPDLDDTIEILRFLHQVSLPPTEKGPAIERSLQWLLSMQSTRGGWGAFDKDNESRWVNQIPFSDHGACLDPPTPDITGRMVELLGLLGYRRGSDVVDRALHFLESSQEDFGPWRGRWGVNFIYGTWCVLTGLSAQGVNMRAPAISKAVGWLLSIQNSDGGWGESCLSDRENHYVPLRCSIPSQTAWAVLSLIASGEANTEACRRGVEFLIQSQRGGRWEERHFTGTGFPGHFYIRYHGYRQYFPLLALARFAELGVPLDP